MTCSFSYLRGHKVTSTFWFTKIETEDLGQNPEYAGRLEYHGDKKKDCTLRITDLRERDYVLVQTINRSGRRDIYWQSWSHSVCHRVISHPTYIWYKNGHKVKEDTSSLDSDSFSDADSYSCAVKGHEDLHSPAVYKKCWSVTYTHQKICALKGSTVDISCSYTYPSYHEIKQAFWFTKWSGMEAEDLSSVPRCCVGDGSYICVRGGESHTDM
ncbi:uncharacterized protein LOC135532098 [Oncorhynchus masou masou]|uniref:uncharacterized protein LOC135532098 n=1 Tax=Oncorhynchus masou masou TaxID=90313 RepID=UPI0031841B0F